jgi:hypothetical protein
MLERAQTRSLPLLNRAVDLSPAVQACCGVCRTCATTNILAVGSAAAAGLATVAVRFIKRLRPR